jgi:hypothetical protein
LAVFVPGHRPLLAAAPQTGSAVPSVDSALQRLVGSSSVHRERATVGEGGPGQQCHFGVRHGAMDVSHDGVACCVVGVCEYFVEHSSEIFFLLENRKD